MRLLQSKPPLPSQEKQQHLLQGHKLNISSEKWALRQGSCLKRPTRLSPRALSRAQPASSTVLSQALWLHSSAQPTRTRQLQNPHTLPSLRSKLKITASLCSPWPDAVSCPQNRSGSSVYLNPAGMLGSCTFLFQLCRSADTALMPGVPPLPFSDFTVAQLACNL